MKYALQVAPRKKLKLKDVDADAQGEFSGKDDPRVEREMTGRLARLAEYQERLFAEKQRSLLVVLQAMDTAGKDAVLHHVVGPLDSRGTEVVNFGVPNAEEAAHDFLWRVHAKAPRKGQLTLFNRSHYEDVLVTRVMKLVDKPTCLRRYQHINAFEAALTDAGTTIVKIFLYISRAEQKQRLEERLSDPEKHWKFDPADLVARAHWDDYMSAYEDAMSATSTRHAPWFVVPSNRKWYRNLAVAYVLEKTLERMDPKYPKPKGFDPKKYKIAD